MNNQTLGSMIATLRKEHNMTQLQLAEKMGVTDKAVSKWERDLSCPDVASLPRLAELFGITVDEMLQVKETARSQPAENKTEKIMDIVNNNEPHLALFAEDNRLYFYRKNSTHASMSAVFVRQTPKRG